MTIAPRAVFHVTLKSGHVLELGKRTLVMGIVNVTPDSFAEAGPRGVEEATRLALALEREGADILDIGGESTRPGADEVPADVELGRVIPVIEALAPLTKIPISVDTYKAQVAASAVAAGATIINDISGLRYDPALGDVAARTGAALVLMHTRGRSRDMYREAVYHDVGTEIVDELGASLSMARRAGVDKSRVILDPGLGFAKAASQSYEALAGRRASRFLETRLAPRGPPTGTGARRRPSRPRSCSGRTWFASTPYGTWWTWCVWQTRSGNTAGDSRSIARPPGEIWH
jgi:dihydropteroate synthase